ncbi:adenosylcobinamide-phosphate synthase CbiB [Natronolimnohabitans innermongolicus]|uniref:Probable cobalamin biosynthesis protein CobD n=1 Tax=Natronolimnohabitans innermongolicus JCM 12255 TaxID=1227499 RepID=L9WW70_9EURY|nr:adenosylcobinamide-phosphate synthase CbiB [Natronolimnohabitans innermongolicus]ELY52583.1 cobalamin biosynthesis protein CobD [Natronolimnohabitans innermongolicus JCM 12255]
MLLTTVALLGLAFSLDLLVGEPPNAFHPVAWFGRLVAALDREWADSERGRRLAGVGIALFAPLVPALAAGGAVILATELAPLAGAVVAGLVLFLTTSLRSLLALTSDVVDATGVDRPDGPADLEAAREQVRGLVGRDTSSLLPAQLRSAAVESAGENLADGLVATLLPFALLAPLSLPLAAAVAAWVKAVNTLDSMLGYPSKPHGAASARLDDAVMWLPARIAAVAIAVAGADPRALARARRWAREPPSPNSGWPMATLACVLSVRLTKVGVYDLNTGAELPTLEDGKRAVSVVGLAGVVAIVIAIGLAVAMATVGPTVDGGEQVPAEPVSAAVALFAGAEYALEGASATLEGTIGLLESGVRTWIGTGTEVATEP